MGRILDFSFEMRLRGAYKTSARNKSAGTLLPSTHLSTKMDILIARYHLHPIIDHFTIALCTVGILADIVGCSISASPGNRNPGIRALGDSLRKTALVLVIPGAISAILSRFTGESEAERIWDSISPAAQRILLSDDGPQWLFSHAVLGTYLMYPLIAIAMWRVMLELSARIARTQIGYLLLAAVLLCAVLYQGKTGGELVYQYGAGTNRTARANSDN